MRWFRLSLLAVRRLCRDAGSCLGERVRPVLGVGGALAIAVLSACSSVNYAQNGSVAPRAPREPSLIVIHMHGDAPPKNFTVSGSLHASAGNPARSLEMLREEAAKNGLDGVADVNCAPSGARDEGSCDGQGFVYK